MLLLKTEKTKQNKIFPSYFFVSKLAMSRGFLGIRNHISNLGHFFRGGSAQGWRALSAPPLYFDIVPKIIQGPFSLNHTIFFQGVWAPSNGTKGPFKNSCNVVIFFSFHFFPFFFFYFSFSLFLFLGPLQAPWAPYRLSGPPCELRGPPCGPPRPLHFV